MTREQWLEHTVAARRAARFRFAKERIRRIRDQEPALTTEQRAELAEMLLAPGGDER
jgi:hypothetical protein